MLVATVVFRKPLDAGVLARLEEEWRKTKSQSKSSGWFGFRSWRFGGGTASNNKPQHQQQQQERQQQDTQQPQEMRSLRPTAEQLAHQRKTWCREYTALVKQDGWGRRRHKRSRNFCRLLGRDAERINRLLTTNVTSCFLCSREAVKRMSTERGGKGGSIVNVSSPFC